MPTANNVIQDAEIRHQIALERVAKGSVNQASRFIRNVIAPQIEEELARRLPNIKRGNKVSTATNKRLRQLKKAVDKIVSDGLTELSRQEFASLLELSKKESAFQVNTLKKAVPVGDFKSPSARTLRESLTKVSFDGALYKDWWSGLSQVARNSINRAIQDGIKNGETTDEILDRVRRTRGARGAIGKMEDQAKALVRTATTHITTQTKQAVFEENSDVIKKVKWVAVLDGRTSLICIELDANVYPIDEGPRPPAHINCRSTIVPVVSSYAKFGLKDPPASTRASLDGQVPEGTNYEQFLKRQSKRFQDSVLGKARAKLWRSGKIKVEQFTDENLRPLTVQELQEL